MGKAQEIKNETKQEGKERMKVRREKLAGYFFNLSQLTFVALVLGGITPLYTSAEIGVNWYILIVGSLLTVVLASIGNKILK